MAYLQSKDDFLPLFLKHVNTSAIVDVFLRLLTTIDNYELRNNVIDWLKQIQIVERLIELISSEQSSQIQSNVSQVLCDIIHIFREQMLTSMDGNSGLSSIDSNKSSEIDELNKMESNDSKSSDDESKPTNTNSLVNIIEA